MTMLKTPSLFTVETVTKLTVLRTQTADDNYSFLILKRPSDFTFTAGQCVKIGLVGTLSSEARIFSIASIPDEKDMIILVKNGDSDYKKKVLALKPGEQVAASSPTGGFMFDKKAPAVMIAGGMGIAPFRSIVKDVIDSGYRQPINLIHLSRDTNPPFKQDFLALQQQFEFFHFSHFANEDKRPNLQKLILRFVNDSSSENPAYYLAGPVELVDSCWQALLLFGVDPLKIHTDFTLPVTAYHGLS